MDLTTEVFSGEGLTKVHPQAAAYIANIIRNPDPGSNFERLTRRLRESITDDRKIINTLAEQNYGVMIGYSGPDIVGHIAYQEHLNNRSVNWHVFHIYLLPEQRRKGLSIPLMENFLDYALQNKIPVAQFGTKTDQIIEKIIRRRQKSGIVPQLNLNKDNHLVTLG